MNLGGNGEGEGGVLAATWALVFSAMGETLTA